MSYTQLEASAHDGAPVELYRFAYGTNRWTLTSGVRPVTHEGDTYVPTALQRGGIEQSNELNRAALEITLPRAHALVGLFVAAPPEGVVSVTLFRFHGPRPEEVITLWKGRVAGMQLAGARAVLRCAPVSTSLKRTGLRARYSLSCRHALYSPGCGVIRDSFRTPGMVLSVTGTTVRVAAAASQPDGYFVAGLVSTPDGQRMIVGHTGEELSLIAPLPVLAAGMSVDLFAGCDHATATCQARFNNLAHYGGFPFIPGKNPFAGDAIV